MKKVLFEDRHGDGEGPWTISVDGKVVIEDHPGDQLDVSDSSLEPLWDAIGVKLTFKWQR